MLAGGAGLGELELAVEVGGDALALLLVVLLADDAGLDHLVDVERQDGGVLADHRVHLRLRHLGRVHLVVPVLAVAHDVQDERLVERLAVLRRQLRRPRHGVAVVAVDVQDGAAERLGDVGGVRGGAGAVGVGGEADLVVDDDVDGAAGGVRGQVVQVQRLVHHALPGEGGVAVHHDAHGPRAALVVGVVLLGARLALHHGVDGLEVRGVGDQRQVHLLAVVRLAVHRRAEVVLDVARSGLVAAGAEELGEDLLVRLAHDVGQKVEAATVGHAEHHVLDAEVRGAVNEGLQRGDGGLATLEAEALGACELDLEEALVHVGPHEAVEGDALGGDDGLAGLGELLQLVLQPPDLLAVGHLHVLQADGAAVRVLEVLPHLAQRARVALQRDDAIEVPLGEAVRLDAKLVRNLEDPLPAEGVEVGGVVAPEAERADQAPQVDLVADLSGRGAAGG